MATSKEMQEQLVRGPDSTRTVGRWTRHLMGREAQSDGAMADALEAREGGQWPGFCRELFGELYGLGTKAIPEEERAAGTEWIGEVLDQAAQLPEWVELKARSEGDPWRCGLGTNSAVKALEGALNEALDQLPEEDPQELQQKADEMEQELEDFCEAKDKAWKDPSNTPEQCEEMERKAVDMGAEVAQAQVQADVAKAEAQGAAKALQEGGNGAELRKALRAAADEAHEEMDQMDGAMAGLGHGFGSGALASAKAPSEQVAEALRRNPKLRRIAEIAGRIRLSAKRQQASKCDFGREEICDVEQGNDVQRLLPSEMVMLTDPELEPLVMRRLVERQALQYKLRGTEKAERGPIVVMVDGSGSMAGARNEWAMGVALAMLEVAAMQRRAFALVHFDTTVKAHYVVPNPRALTLDKLVEMVCFFSNGGTNIQVALEWVREHLLEKEQALKGADILLVTDGQSGDFGPAVRDLHKTKGAATYGIAIQQPWDACNTADLEGYHHVQDEQIRSGKEDISGVLAL
jgi:uncharacterized protein with von Willebrand factor type A (vWA) domain